MTSLRRPSESAGDGKDIACGTANSQGNQDMNKISAITIAGSFATVCLVAVDVAHASTTGLVSTAQYGSLVLANLPIPSPGAMALAVLGCMIILRRNKAHVQK